MPESNAAKLRRRFPTHESFNSAIKASGSKLALARELGMLRQTLNDHAKWLRNGAKAHKEGPRITNCDMTNGELDARIKEMFGRKYEEVKVYKLTDGFVPGQTGTEGLEFVRTETSRTAISLWAKGGGVS